MLYTQVKSGDERLLTHPVVRALLHYKWWHYGFGYYMTNIIFFLLFLIFATSFSLSVVNPLSPDCKLLQRFVTRNMYTQVLYICHNAFMYDLCYIYRSNAREWDMQ